MRIGPELYHHFASLGLVFAAFLLYDLKKEKWYLFILVLMQAITFVLTEFSVFQVAEVNVSNISAHRSIVLIGTLIFLVIELYLFKDIIERSEAKVIQELQKSNNEKDILLKEIHHRVKNNLQLLSSLIRLRMNSEGNSIAEEQLRDINSRIRSIALLHNKVYLNESIQYIEFELFVTDLFNELKMNIDYKDDLKINVDSDLKETNLNNMVPLALILNELITNSFKHGMKDNDKKEIFIKIKRVELNTYKMLYSDSGVWKEQPSETNSMGLSLINSLSEQLDGSFEILDTDNTKRKISQIIFTIS
ncbi:MAG: sensor histidine kinase [Crocinitomicaceae bacterium]